MVVFCLHLTNVQHDKFYVHYNTFCSVISKIRIHLPPIKCKGKNITYAILESFINIFIKKQVMNIFKQNCLYILK